MLLNQFLLLAAVLFCIGVYGVIARRNGVIVLMSIELILNAVNINLVAFGAMNGTIAGQVFALFVIAVAAAEVGVGLAIVLVIYRNRRSDRPRRARPDEGLTPMLTHAWIIPLIPALSFVLILVFGKRLPARRRRDRHRRRRDRASSSPSPSASAGSSGSTTRRRLAAPRRPRQRDRGRRAHAEPRARPTPRARPQPSEAEPRQAATDEAAAEGEPREEAEAEEEHHVDAAGGPQGHLVRDRRRRRSPSARWSTASAPLMLLVVTLISLLVHIYSHRLRRRRPPLHPLLRVPQPVHRVDAVLRPRREHAADDRGLGAGRRLLVRAHRPLVGGEAELRRRAQGVPHQPRGRRGPARRR